MFEDLEMEDVNGLVNLNINQLNKFAASYADGIVQASENIDNDVIEYVKSLDKPFMEFPGEENYKDAYLDFYEIFTAEKEEVNA